MYMDGRLECFFFYSCCGNISTSNIKIAQKKLKIKALGETRNLDYIFTK